MDDYPAMIAPVGHVEPVPRRIRAYLGSEPVLDTTRALYVWEQPYYPRYYIPLADLRPDVLVDEQRTERSPRGPEQLHGVRVGDEHRSGVARLLGEPTDPALAGTVRFDWAGLDSWSEEDEQVFVHPRSPYVRVDALRSTRTVRVELRGTLLAESDSPVLVFETGLPTRYYLSRTAVRFEHLIPTDTQTQSPYKGTTSGYWSARVDGRVHPDLRVDLRLPDAGVAADRRDAGVLQRAGRHRAGRRPSRTATNPLRTLTGRRLRTVFYRPESDPTG